MSVSVSSVTFRLSRISIPAFSVTLVLTRTNRVLDVARIYDKHSKCCDKFFVLTMSLYTLISLLYKQLLQYTLLKTFSRDARRAFFNIPILSVSVENYPYPYPIRIRGSIMVKLHRESKNCPYAYSFSTNQ